MKTHITFRAMALAGVCLAPLTAVAQTLDEGGAATYNNEIELGARWQSQSSPVYGRYNGATEKGFTFVGAFDVQGRAPSAGLGQNFYYEAFGRELDVNQKDLAPNGSLGFKIGSQGTWSLGGDYDSISHSGQTFNSPWTSDGTLASGLKAFGGATATTKGNTTYQSSLVEQTAGTRREIVGGNGKYIYGDWTFSTRIQNEHKEGTLLRSMRTTGGTVSFPEPVNYDTQRYSVKSAYTANRLQAVVSYDYSKFTDNASFNAPYWFSNSSTPYQVTATYGLPPSNDAHLINGSVGYDLTQNTRINGGFHYGLEQQNDDVNLGTGTTAWQSKSNPQTSRLLARLYGGDVSITASPLEHLDLRGAYNLDARQEDNYRTALYGSNSGDGAASTNYSTPLGWTNQTASLDAGYRILAGTKLSLGYVYKDINRSYLDTSGAATNWYSHSGENTVSTKLSVRPMTGLNGSVAYEHSIRAANYANYTSGGGALWYQAPMVADSVKLRSSYAPMDDLSVGLNGKFTTHHYNYPVHMYGLERDSNGSIGPDITFQPSKTLSTHLFYTYERIFYGNQTGGGSRNPIASSTNGWYGVSTTSTNEVHTVGLSGEWRPIDKLKISSDYVLEYGNIGYNVFDGLVVTSASQTAAYQNIQNVPNVSSSMHTVKLKGEYELAPNLSLLAGYQFDVLSTNDWAYSYGSTSISGALLSGETSPSYRVHTVYTAVRMKF